jgi:hypothetical protein
VTRRGGTIFGVALAIVIALVALFLFSRRGHSELAASDCDPQSCATPACPPGARLELAKDSCCPVCVPTKKGPPLPLGPTAPRAASSAEPSAACATGQALYLERFTELEPELRACEVDSDCIYASFGDACRASCPLPVNKVKLGPVVSSLRAEAEARCDDCDAPAFDCTHRDSTAVACVRGRCELSAP